MSFEAMRWASEQQAGASINKLLLLLLGNYADQNYECFPSIGKLAKMAEASESTIRRSLRDLEARGLIKINQRVHGPPPGWCWWQHLNCSCGAQLRSSNHSRGAASSARVERCRTLRSFARIDASPTTTCFARGSLSSTTTFGCSRKSGASRCT